MFLYELLEMLQKIIAYVILYYYWALCVISLLLQFLSVYVVNIPTMCYGVFIIATRLQDRRFGFENR